MNSQEELHVCVYLCALKTYRTDLRPEERISKAQFRAKMSDIGDWFKSIPAITRYWFAGSIAVPLIGKLGLISPMYLVLWPKDFFHKFQVSVQQHLCMTVGLSCCLLAKRERLAISKTFVGLGLGNGRMN